MAALDKLLALILRVLELFKRHKAEQRHEDYREAHDQIDNDLDGFLRGRGVLDDQRSAGAEGADKGPVPGEPPSDGDHQAGGGRDSRE